jgi:type I restriction enzyme R subunit
VSKAVTPDGVVDIFAAAGLPRPDISILSDEFLADVAGLPQKNLAVELLRKLLTDEIRTRSRKQLVQTRSFAAMLERAVRTYQNRAVETAQVIEELIELAREMRQAQKRGEAPGFTDEELAFYDALIAHGEAEPATNGHILREARAEYQAHLDSNGSLSNHVVRVMGDETLRTIARELVDTVRRNTTVDWTTKETVRARLRVLVKRILRKYGYPPDKQEKAIQTVLEQAELFGDEWATALAAL